METQHVIMGRAEARDLYRKYKEHKHYSTPVDREVMRAYQLLAQGRPVIKALESIRVAGLNDQGWPELAIAPATAKQVECSLRDNGALAFDARESRSFRTVNEQHLIAERCYFSFPAGSFPRGERRGWWSARAIVPIVPVEHRPARWPTITFFGKPSGPRFRRATRCCCDGSARPICGSCSQWGSCRKLNALRWRRGFDHG